MEYTLLMILWLTSLSLSAQPEGNVSVSAVAEAPHKRKKMVNKHFDMFEQTGLVMGMVWTTGHILDLSQCVLSHSQTHTHTHALSLSLSLTPTEQR